MALPSGRAVQSLSQGDISLYADVQLNAIKEGESIVPTTGSTASPEHIAEAAQHLRESGLIWHFDPTDSSAYLEAEPFEVAVQGIPIGNVGQADRYRIAHNDGSSALDMDGVAYMVWLQWWSEPRLVKAARAVADELGIRRLDVVGRAVGTLVAGMQVGLVYVAKVHKP